jgi:class 3 adenylate cyclase
MIILNYSIPEKEPIAFETDLDTVVFGRNPGSGQQVDLDFVEDEFISHCHARVIRTGDQFWVEDLQSANGTFLNGKKIFSRKRLAPGDVIRVGYTDIEILMDAHSGVAHEATPMDAGAPSGHVPDIQGDVSVAPEDPDDSPTVMTHGDDLSNGMSDVLVASDASPTVVTDMDAIKDSAIYPSSPAISLDSDDAPTIVTEDLLPDFPDGSPDKTPAVVQQIPTVSPVGGERKTQGSVIDVTCVTSHSDTGSIEEISAQACGQLRSLNSFVSTISDAESFDAMVHILVDHLRKAIPNAQRGAVLLPDEQGKLLLKAHWPQGNHSVSMTWVNRAYDRQDAFVWAASDTEGVPSSIPHSIIYHNVQSAIYVPMMVGKEVFGVMYVDNYITRDAFFAADLELMKAIAGQVAMFARDRVLRESLRRESALSSALSRQFPPEIAASLSDGSGLQKLRGERIDPVTILVSDIRNFTALSARMDPGSVVGMLNEMFDAFVPIVFEYGGIVDKFVGDSVLAVFGSPRPDDHQWEKAVKAALEMQQAIEKLSEGRKVRRLESFEVGISVHTGPVIHGFIGSAERMEYTVIGDTVNRASRYCDGAGPGEVVISRSVFERVYHMVEVEPKLIRTKHPDVEPDLKGYVIVNIKDPRA